MEPSQERLLTLPVEQVRPSPFQPRHRFDEAALEELASSIRQQGLIQPVVVRKVGSGYELIAGERRWRAARRAGLAEIPVIVRDYSDEQALEAALVENIQREDISVVETARAYRRLTEEFQYTQGEVALKTGKSRVAVANTLRLLQLPERVLAMLDAGEITEGHGRALLALPYPSLQEEVAEWISRNAVPVREAEARIRKLVAPPRPASGPDHPPDAGAQIAHLVERLRSHFGTKVEVEYRKGAGAIRIEFYDDEDLNRILECLRMDG